MKNFLTTILMLMLSLGAYAQNVSVSGTVTDDRDTPIIGASVILVGTSIGTTTNSSGDYTLSVPSNGTLSFSFLGMNNVQRPVNGQTRLDMKMTEDATKLDEVIVMGYNSKTKAELSSSVVTIKADKLADITSSNIETMLQGKAAGVYVSSGSGSPGAKPEIMIRGAGSITAQASPLFVVDGIIGGSYNPNDVETLTVLKDAAATSLYGSEAAGGVIIVTTKQAKFDQKFSVEAKISMSQKTMDQGNLQMMNSEELWNVQKLYMPSSSFEQTRPKKLIRDPRYNFNWLDNGFQSALLQNYYVAVSGGSDKLTYRTSIDYFNEKGTLLKSGSERLSLRQNVTARLSKKVTLITSVSYENTKQTYPEWSYIQDIYDNMPWDNPYDKGGNAVKISGKTRPDNGESWYGNQTRNLFYNSDYNYDNYSGNALIGDVTLRWQIGGGFSFESRNRASMYNSHQKRFTHPLTGSGDSKGELYESMDLSYGFGTTNLIFWKKQINRHNIDIFVGAEWGFGKSNNFNATGDNLPLTGLDAMNVAKPYAVGGNYNRSAGQSFLGQIQYIYDHRYIASISARADASHKFAPKSRWGTFPAASLAWLASEEKFLKGNKVVTYLKLRGSFGITGNSRIPNYGYMALYDFSYSYNGNPGASAIQPANDYLGWESAWMSNIGIDLGLWQDRITLSLELYNTDNKNLLLNVPDALSSGNEFSLKNAGSVRNQGVEIQLSTINLKGKFTWTTDFNIGFNKNQVYKIPGGEPFLRSYGSYTALSQQIKEGQDVFSWYMAKWAGVNPQDGTPQWEKIGDDGKTTLTGNYAEATQQVVGSASPDFQGGMVNSFSYNARWGTLGLSVNCNFVSGNQVYHLGRETWDNDGYSNDKNQMSLASFPDASRWARAGDNATHPKPVFGGNNKAHEKSSRYLEDGSYFRIRNITLSYTLPKQWANKIKLQHLRIYASMDNLYTATKFSGMNPEVSYSMSAWEMPGMQSSPYPLSKLIVGGIEVKF